MEIKYKNDFQFQFCMICILAYLAGYNNKAITDTNGHMKV